MWGCGGGASGLRCGAGAGGQPCHLSGSRGCRQHRQSGGGKPFPLAPVGWPRLPPRPERPGPLPPQPAQPHLLHDALSAIVHNLLQAFGKVHLCGREACEWDVGPPASPPNTHHGASRLTQRCPLLQVADEVLHVLGHVLGILQRSIHTPLTALQERVHLLGGQAACGGACLAPPLPGLSPHPTVLGPAHCQRPRDSPGSQSSALWGAPSPPCPYRFSMDCMGQRHG